MTEQISEVGIVFRTKWHMTITISQYYPTPEGLKTNASRPLHVSNQFLVLRLINFLFFFFFIEYHEKYLRRYTSAIMVRAFEINYYVNKKAWKRRLRNKYCDNFSCKIEQW